MKCAADARVLFHPGALLCAALSLAEERPRRPVVGHVLLHGYARNGAADHVESQVLQRFEADATFTMSSFLPLFLYSLVNQVERARKGREMREELRSLRSLQDGNENRGQLFALLSQRRELFHADNPRFHEQF